MSRMPTKSPRMAPQLRDGCKVSSKRSLETSKHVPILAMLTLRRNLSVCDTRLMILLVFKSLLLYSEGAERSHLGTKTTRLRTNVHEAPRRAGVFVDYSYSCRRRFRKYQIRRGGRKATGDGRAAPSQDGFDVKNVRRHTLPSDCLR